MTRLARLLAVLRSPRARARLNHILIPEKKEDRDRFRRTRTARALGGAFAVFGWLSAEGRGLFGLSLLVGLAGLDVGQTQVHLLFALLVGLLAASLGARPFFRARGLEVRVEAPARVSVGAPVELLVALENRGREKLTSLRVLLPFLPWDGAWARPGEAPAALGVAVLEPGARATVTARAAFLARGEHHLDSFAVGALVPFGFALGPVRRSDGARFTVVPRVAAVSRLTLAHRQPEERAARAARRAQGEAEFAGVRPYRAGDPLKHLHARTWARTGTPHVKTYLAERSDRVALAVLVDGPDATEDAKELALSLAAGIAARLVSDGVGVSDVFVAGGAAGGGLTPVAPRNGRAALEAVLDRLGVLALGEREEDPTEALAEASGAWSSLVVVTADDAERRRALRDRLRARGLALRWLSVGAGGAGAAPLASSSHVDPGAIERGEALAL